MIKKLLQAFKTIRVKKAQPLHIEFNLTDACNLNCKCCSHYSPLAPREFEPLDELEFSMKKISSARNVDLIKGVYLIGGETLLFPQLKEAILLAKKYFPKAKLSIFTNGLHLPRMDDDFWEICKSNDVEIALTRYPVKFDYDKAEALCRDKGVTLTVFDDRNNDDSFFRFPLDPEKKQNGRISHFKCISYGCITVDHGKIFPCSQAACVGHLNRTFGSDFKWEPGDYIEVDKLEDVKQIEKLRSHPVPFCNYCAPKETIRHGLSRREPSEWILER